MKKSLFRLSDALSFGLPALLATIGSIFLSFSNFKSEASSTEVIGLFVVISAIMWIVYGTILYSRWQLVKNIDFVTKHGWNVVTNGLSVTKQEIEDEVDRTIHLWKDKSGFSNETLNNAIKKINSDWVLFCKPDKIDHERLGMVAGYITGKNITIGFVGSRDIQKTALAHEIGHIVHKEYLGEFSNDLCHEFMRKKGLP